MTDLVNNKEVPKSTILKQYHPSCYKHGYRLERGDKIKVWWRNGDGIDTITHVEKHCSPLFSSFNVGGDREPNSVKISFSDGRELVVGNMEVVQIQGIDELMKNKDNKNNKDNKDNNKPKTQKTSKNNKTNNDFFTVKGKDLKVGDVIGVSWKPDGDKIITLNPYVGPLLNCLPYGALEATFLEHKEPFPIDNSAEYNVFFRKKDLLESLGLNDNTKIHEIEELTEEEERELMAEIAAMDYNEINDEKSEEKSEEKSNIEFLNKEYQKEIGFHTGMNNKPKKLDITIFEV